MIQIKFGEGNGTLRVDNIYFSADLAAAPEPTAAASDVLSIFGTTYGNLAGTDFDPSWGQETDAVVGDEYVLNGLNYQGIQLGSAQDVSGYGYLHIDYYTDDSTAANLYLVSTGPSEVAIALDLTTTGSWNSVDIPLTEFAGVDLADVIQIKFGEGNGTLRVDNIYFTSVQ